MGLVDAQGTIIEIAITVGSSIGLLLLRAVSKSLADLVDEFQSMRDLPGKVEEAIERIENKFDQRMSQNEAKIEIIMGVLADERKCKNYEPRP